MNYIINPDIQPNYNEIKEKFEEIKKFTLVNTNPEINILLSNDYNSCSRGKFYKERHKYIDKIISIFVIGKNNITHIVGPILINNEQKIIDVMYYINEFISTENVYVQEHENLDKKISYYYKKINIDDNKVLFTNIIYS